MMLLYPAVVFSGCGEVILWDIRECLETFLAVTAGVLGLLVRGRDATKHPALHNTAPPTKNYLAQSNSSADIEKP